MRQEMSFTATGDSFITRRLLKTNNEDFNNIESILRKGEFRFTNLEVTTHYFEGYPSAESGGTWAITDPSALDDIKSYGFNAVAWANNHTLDYSHGGLEATMKYLDERKIVHAGVGKKMADASAPKYIECSSGRVALISVTSTFHDSGIAGEQRADIGGRPGINPLRYNSDYIVTKKQMKHLKKIAEDTFINADYNLAVKEGFKLPSDKHRFQFGGYHFKTGETPGMVTSPLAEDMDRVIKSIQEAERQADYVIISVHSHEMEGEEKDQPPLFLKEFSRNCIDAGAHAIIGHGPHILRGIEIYKNAPIFYSLGNFIFQNDTVTRLPHEFYNKYGLDFSHNVADALDKRSHDGEKGLGVNPDVWESVIPHWTMKDGILKEIQLYPIDLGYGLSRYKRGWPKLNQEKSILKKLKQLSAPFGTEIELKNNIGVIHNI